MKCRSCGGASFGSVIDLGPMPLVNNLLRSPDDTCQRWPLEVVFCRACSLAQLRSDAPAPPAEAMFDEYLYFSSQSQTMVSHAAGLADRFVQSGQRVLEIASNDGYLLRHAQARGAKVLGVDPARNVASHAEAQGVPTQCDYFNATVADDIRRAWGAADVIFANNVLAHVPDPNEIVAGIGIALSDRGVAHIEVPWLVQMIQQRAFDTIYHEHQCYFSATALRELFARHGLRIIDVELLSIHGGSLHLQVARRGPTKAMDELCAREQHLGVKTDAYYAGFAEAVGELRRELLLALEPFELIASYGAAAKGVVLLNHFGLTADRVAWVCDVSPHKQGRFIPGTRQPVVETARLLDEQPEAALLLAWNLADEIVRLNQQYLDQGGRFIVPIPDVRIVSDWSHECPLKRTA